MEPHLLRDNSEDTHHGSTSVVELGVLLAEFLAWFLVPVVDLSKPDTVVSIKLAGRPPGKLNKSTSEDDLEESGRWDLEKTSDSAVDVRELKVLRRGKVSIEDPFVVVDKSSGHGHHGNTSVLALNSTVTLELLGGSDVSERIEESERSGGSNLSGLCLQQSCGGLERSNIKCEKK